MAEQRRTYFQLKTILGIGVACIAGLAALLATMLLTNMETIVKFFRPSGNAD